ncbi:histidine kinase dimerization/phospho-acceptor domain-containing protein, partial [Actinokineospora sp.]|uniref:histidine kinase dimerization/phospho-acceptor domain-containing protein n=1 Tax=Actinokineospora sp. TaxID=1872133 RepID=UPI003D6BEB0C
AAQVTEGRTVIVARSPSTTYGALRTLRGLLIGVISGAVLITAVASWLYARAALRPIDRVVEAARAVRDSHDVSRRVPHRGRADEIGRLTDTFNEMLAELQQLYTSLDSSNQRMRQFLADCSHELRTPLTCIQSTVDTLARTGDDDPGFAAQALADIGAETDRMARMVRQLLILARADAGATIEPRQVELGTVLDTVSGQAARMADGHTSSCPHPAPWTA